MALVEAGRICIKKFGRDAGSRAVVTKVIDANFVEVISQSRPKERRCNIKHLEFLTGKIDPKDKVQLESTLEIKPKEQHHQKQQAKKPVAKQ